MSEFQRWERRDSGHFCSGEGWDIFDIHAHFARWLAEARPGGDDLYELSASSAPGRAIQVGPAGVDHRAQINLASYNDLGLAQDPRVLEAAAECLARYGLGTA